MNRKISQHCSYYSSASHKTLKRFPKESHANDIFTDEDYIYKLILINSFYLEWSVKVKDITKTSYRSMRDEINGFPVTMLNHTYEGCFALISAPVLSKNAISLNYCFFNCKELIQAPFIPKTTLFMNNTFENCFKLSIIPEWANELSQMNSICRNCFSLSIVPDIPESVLSMNLAFYNCPNLKQKPIVPISVALRLHAFDCDNAFSTI